MGLNDIGVLSNVRGFRAVFPRQASTCFFPSNVAIHLNGALRVLQDYMFFNPYHERQLASNDKHAAAAKKGGTFAVAIGFSNA
jgi:hypothetical protein